MWIVQLELFAYESTVQYWSLEEPFFQRDVDVVEDPLWPATDFSWIIWHFP